MTIIKLKRECIESTRLNFSLFFWHIYSSFINNKQLQTYILNREQNGINKES